MSLKKQALEPLYMPEMPRSLRTEVIVIPLLRADSPATWSLTFTISAGFVINTWNVPFGCYIRVRFEIFRCSPAQPPAMISATSFVENSERLLCEWTLFLTVSTIKSRIAFSGTCPNKYGANPLYNLKNPSFVNTFVKQSKLFLYNTSLPSFLWVIHSQIL